MNEKGDGAKREDRAGRNDREGRIAELKGAFLEGKKLSPTKLAARIREYGFHCLQCGECCRGEDHSVVVFPLEIRRILTATGLGWLDVVSPPEEGEWDKDGSFHTLEWRLKKEGGSCRFYQNGRCSVYLARPMLCSTYPFYLDNGVLMCSECRGLGGKIESDEADKMAERLILRYLFEIQEAIALLEIYRDFERGEAGKSGECIVHDSEGEHRIVGEELVE
ncbi:MAG: YkgJ family cysteine cluster protein [Methanothrix sp.]|nr:YkgJ family cysteine cluster protein [Methanothrix sp.]